MSTPANVRRPFPIQDNERMVVVPLELRPVNMAYLPPLAAEIGRNALALRGWRRALARWAGLPLD